MGAGLSLVLAKQAVGGGLASTYACQMHSL